MPTLSISISSKFTQNLDFGLKTNHLAILFFCHIKFVGKVSMLYKVAIIHCKVGLEAVIRNTS
jgi:hypothetical protein